MAGTVGQIDGDVPSGLKVSPRPKKLNKYEIESRLSRSRLFHASSLPECADITDDERQVYGYV